MKKYLIIVLIILIATLTTFLVINNNNYIDGELYITNKNNEKIYAVLHRPDKKGKMPLVIYSHGLGATYRACSDYADDLEDYGIATLCFDFRGGSDRSKSDGLTTEMSFLTEIEDLNTVIEYAKKWDFVDLDNIILMGSSQGGAISALVSAERDDIKGLVLLYPALSIPSVMQRLFPSKELIPEERELTSSITVGKKYFLDIWDMDVYEMIKKDKKQIIIIQGTNDDLVSPDQSKKVNDTYENSELYFIEGAPHGFEDDDFKEAMKYIIEYLKKINIIK
jgi:hypothetical protein